MNDQPEKKLSERPRIIFMGTPDFAVPALSKLVGSGHNVISVITQPDRPKGRGRKVLPSPVKQTAANYGIEVLQPEHISNAEFCDEIRRRDPEVFVVVAFGQILKKEFLDIPGWGAINIHASLLPRYRGAAPIHCAILNNESKTGLTAMKMDEGLDTGPILQQEEVPILPDETVGQLHDRLSKISGQFLIRILKDLSENRLKALPQDEEKATYSSKIDKHMSRVRWDRPAQTVSAFIRALDPWPGAFTTLEKKNIKLFSSRVIDERYTSEISGGMPGRVVGYSKGSLEVETAKGVVQIRELQAPGKKRLPAKDFFRGFSIKENAILV